MRTTIVRRLSSLGHLMRPLALAFIGIVLLSLGVAYLFKQLYHTLPLPSFFYYLTLQFLPTWVRGGLFLIVGLLVLGYGVWQLSGVVVIPLHAQVDQKELVLGYQRLDVQPKIVVLSGGAGMFMMASMGKQVEHLTCITPIQDPVEYYYRASSLFTAEYVEYLPPTPVPAQVIAELSDRDHTRVDLKRIRKVVSDPRLAGQHVDQLTLELPTHKQGKYDTSPPIALSRPVLDALAEADALVLGPGSLFESILPNLLIPEMRAAIQGARMRTIYVCNLMTEPGLTSGFSVADHIRAIKRYGGFTPDYVLVNAERIEPEVQRLYEAAKQVPVFLDPDEGETAVLASENRRQANTLVEGAVVLEANLASDLFQSTASIDAPGESRAVRVLRHDPDKLAAAILALLKRET